MAVAHRYHFAYNDPAGHPYVYAYLCYDCQAVNLDWEYPLPRARFDYGQARVTLATRPIPY